MNRFRVVMIHSSLPLLEWVPKRLEEAGVDFVQALCSTREDLARYAGDADLVWVNGGGDLLKIADNMALLRRCGAILRSGSGTDNINIEAATELGIIVAHTPHAVAEPVADHAISLLFSLVRQVTRHDRLIRRGIWDPWQALPSRRFRGATLGLVGFGRIPRLIVRKLGGFEMNFLAYDPYVTPELMASYGVKSAPLDELLQTADYVSVHCPLTQETCRLIGEREFRLMQPHALFVNTSRGKVIDEQALIKALQEKWIAGAALDVLEQEPTSPDNPLLRMENVIITPHIGGHSERFPDDYWYETSVEAICDLAQHRWPRAVVNPKVKPRWGTLAPCIHAQ